MKYTADNLWEAIYKFIPTFKTARDNGVYMNLPSCLNSAIVTSDLMAYEYKNFDIPVVEKFDDYRDFMLRAARELQNAGQFNFEE